MKRVVKILSVIVMITSGVTWVAVLALLIAAKWFSIVTVISGSMIPTLNIGDSVVVKKCNAADCGVGDIIVYEDDSGMNIIHRVMYKGSVIEDDKIKTYLKTRGDANSEEDKITVTNDNHIRKVIVMPNEKLKRIVKICNNRLIGTIIGLVMTIGILVVANWFNGSKESKSGGRSMSGDEQMPKNAVKETESNVNVEEENSYDEVDLSTCVPLYNGTCDIMEEEEDESDDDCEWHKNMANYCELFNKKAMIIGAVAIAGLILGIAVAKRKK